VNIPDSASNSGKDRFCPRETCSRCVRHLGSCLASTQAGRSQRGGASGNIPLPLPNCVHYVSEPVGENLQYAVTDKDGRLLACLLFGSAAWKCKPRDGFIGWNTEQRQRNLHLVTNNTRFLILPFVRVPHLASWILGRVLRRLSADWRNKYGHPILLVETFVERERFAGTSYKAANWLRLGSTTGRSRQDRQHTLEVPVKDVYTYPLHRGFRRELSA